MNKIYALVLAALLLVPAALATSVGTGVGVNMETEDFKPLIWLCDHRKIVDDNIQQWRNWTGNATHLTERIGNYAFEGEQVKWRVLVMDKNGIEKIKDVYVTLGVVQGEGNDIEVNCDLSSQTISNPSDECGARILEEKIETFDADTMAVYDCVLTVEPADSMYGEYWVTAEVEDLDGQLSTFDENEYWFFNPTIALSIDGNIDFGIVRPGTTAYSDTILVGNDADAGSGVILDMFITGTDFYDPTSSGAKCPTTNQLALTNFTYYAVKGAYSTADVVAPYTRLPDNEGYLSIQYGDHWDRSLYGKAEVLPAAPINGGALGYAANLLAPGQEIAVTFKLNLPEPCNGDFSDGSIYFWGEAI